MQGIEFTAADGAADAKAAAAVPQARQLLTLTCGPAGNFVLLIPALVVTRTSVAGLTRLAVDEYD